MKIEMIFQRRFSRCVIQKDKISPTLKAGAGGGGNNVPFIILTEDNKNEKRK